VRDGETLLDKAQKGWHALHGKTGTARGGGAGGGDEREG